jgi:hypothetical protein
MFASLNLDRFVEDGADLLVIVICKGICAAASFRIEVRGGSWSKKN